METLTTFPGKQSLHLMVLDNVEPYRTLDVELFDPALSGLPAPEPTGETVALDSVSASQITVQVIAAGEGDEQSFGVGWLTSNDLWLTVTSDGPIDLARQEVLSVAAQVDLGRPFPLTFPFQLGYVPEGFDVAGATSTGTLVGGANLDFHDLTPLFPGQEPALSITAINDARAPEDGAANTSIGRTRHS